MVPQNCSVSHILQNIFLCIQQNKDIHTGWNYLRVSKWWHNFQFWVNYPFKYIPSCSSNHSMISERVICLLLSNKVVCYFLNHRWYTSEYTQKHLTTLSLKNILKQFTSKWKFCYHLLAIMLFQTHKCFVCNTKEDVNETWEISVAPLRVHTTQTLSFKKSIKYTKSLSTVAVIWCVQHMCDDECLYVNKLNLFISRRSPQT